MRTAALILAAAVGASAQAPVGVVVSAADAELRRAGNELPLSARAGDLLFPGDSVSAGAPGATVRFCPTREEYRLEAGSRLIVEAGRARLAGGRIAGQRQLGSCVLPPLNPAEPDRVRFFGARLSPPAAEADSGGSFESRVSALPETDRRQLQAELAPVEQALSKDPGDTAARLARAAILQKYRLAADAGAEYERVSAAWKEVDWPRQLVFEQREEARKAGARRAEPREPGKVYALLVGISSYPRLGREAQLQYAHRDASLFAEYLGSPRGGRLPEDQLRVLLEKQATTAAIRTAVASFLRARAKSNDTVILFLAAHGVVDEKGTAYVVTYDSDPEDLGATALRMAEIQGLMEDDFASVGRVLVYVDICRAGTIGTIRSNEVNHAVQVLLRARNREVLGLLASGPGEYSYENERFGGGHGAFSYFVLRGLNGEADEDADGEVSCGELINYVRGRVQEATLKRQTPRETGNMGAATRLVEDLDRPGIQLAGWRPLDPLMARRRNVAAESRGADAAAQRLQKRIAGELDEFEDALEAGRILPETAGSAFFALERLRARLRGRPAAVLELENRLRVALQEKGQQVLLGYLRGDQVPQQRADFVSGELYFRSALQLDPDAWALHSRALFCQGRARIFDKRYGDAIELLERAVRIDTRGAYAFNALGIAYLERAEYPRAVAAFRDAISRAPHWVYPVHNLALALAEQGDYERAAATYREAMRLAPGHSYLPYNLGLLFQRLNRRRDAETAFREAIRLAPGGPEAYNALGLLKAAAGKTREAEALYRDALARDPAFLPARHNLALAAAGGGRADDAIAQWRRITVEAPDFLPARLGLARALARRGDTDGAAAEFRALLRVRPDSLAARLELAGLLIAGGNPDEGIAALRECLRREPGNALMLEKLGDAESARGRRAEAEAAYRSALEGAADQASRKRLRAKLRP